MMGRRVLGLMVVCVLCGRAGAQEKPADRLAPLARFAGEWTFDGKWADGTPLKARAAYEWGLGGKILKGKTFIINADGEERQRYEDVMTWDPRRNSLVDVSFSVDGGFSTLVVEGKDPDTLQFGWTPYEEGKPGKVRQTIQFEGKDRYVWTVLLEQDGQWREIMRGAWLRKR